MELPILLLILLFLGFLVLVFVLPVRGYEKAKRAEQGTRALGKARNNRENRLGAKVSTIQGNDDSGADEDRHQFKHNHLKIPYRSATGE